MPRYRGFARSASPPLHSTLWALRPLSRTELVEFRMTVYAAIGVRDANVSAAIPNELNGLFDSRRSRVLLRDNAPAESVPVIPVMM
jgi:hypothetical protein